jgi:hypothetical protein
MNYEYVKDLPKVNPTFSSTLRLWKHLATNTYYISYDQREIIKPVVDNRYMLLSDKPNTKLSPYRGNLSLDAKQLTSLDFLNERVEYNGSYWKLN